MAESMKNLAPGRNPEVIVDMRSDGSGLLSRADPREVNPPRSGSSVEARHRPPSGSQIPRPAPRTIELEKPKEPTRRDKLDEIKRMQDPPSTSKIPESALDTQRQLLELQSQRDELLVELRRKSEIEDNRVAREKLAAEQEKVWEAAQKKPLPKAAGGGCVGAGYGDCGVA